VDGATVTPSFASSPWIRRCPYSGFSLARRTTGVAMLGIVGGRPGLRRLLVSYFFAASRQCQARRVARQAGKTSVQRRCGMSRASAVNHTRSVGSYRTGRTVGAALSAQHCVLVTEHQQFSHRRPVVTAQQDGQAEYPVGLDYSIAACSIGVTWQFCRHHRCVIFSVAYLLARCLLSCMMLC
jgi:hypothetical protein